MTSAELARLLHAALDERLLVDDPRPYPEVVSIVEAPPDSVVVLQRDGRTFVVRVET